MNQKLGSFGEFVISALVRSANTESKMKLFIKTPKCLLKKLLEVFLHRYDVWLNQPPSSLVHVLSRDGLACPPLSTVWSSSLVDVLAHCNVFYLAHLYRLFSLFLFPVALASWLFNEVAVC